MGQRSYKRQAILDIAKGLKSVFKDYTRPASKYAWERLTSTKGKAAVNRLIVNPDQPLNKFMKLAFREWLESGTIRQ